VRAIILTLAALLGYGKATPPAIVSAIEATAPDADTARLMLVWGIGESSLRNSAIGDGGASRCWLQVKYLGGLDEENCARAWLGILRYAETKCGSRRSALGSLATGHCGGAPRLIQRRLDDAGVVLP
jgi:hypothetical protein